MIGAGDIASRLAPLLHADGYQLTGIRRSAEKKTSPLITLKQADAAQPDDCQAILAPRPDVVVMTLTPSDYSDSGYEQGYVKPVKALVEALLSMDDYQPLILFVSSTSVYAQRNGEWVDEDSPARPDSFAGRRLLEAEQVLEQAVSNCCIVRFSGIYGPGREGLLMRIRQQALTLTPAWTNRIHSNDCAGILAHLIRRYMRGITLERVYIGSDNEPVRQARLVEFIAAEHGLDWDSLRVSDRIGGRGNKRLSAQRLLDSGYVFRVPSFRVGYRNNKL